MEFKEREFIPVVLGGDINTYSVARAFYEQYQVKTYTFGKYPSGPSYNSKITEYSHNPKNDEDAFFLENINRFAKQHESKKIIILGCGDNYVSLISRYQKELAENIIAPYIEYDLMNELQQKQLFYQLCDKHEIDYPDTIVHTKDMGLDFEMNFSYPVILKPSESVEYWKHSFATQEKVYSVNNRKELNKIISDIYGAGYEDALIIQDTIPGNDEHMRVLTSYSDQNGKVKMMCLGHVLLEEHTPRGKGNHALIITEFNEELMLKAKKLLEDLNYVGFSNFDIKFDTRDGKFKFFELNTRQGRSNYYVTGSGFNIAKYLVEEHIYGKELEFEMAKKEHLWMVIPKTVAFKYVKDETLKEKMRQLIREKKVVNPIFFHKDFVLKRFMAMLKTHLSHFIKFKKYYY
ncbi:ATP-grasp domain-containing protein [Alkalibaculum bacchi]|uniref:carboxylate--amine ligase n=1 Tax=Alkalibaculum bacchi TaxID=645887 RepID=UPI0026EBDD2E|nr:ATP-grasp domain-containing protein [Alkalibaculum bacchi]